MRHTLATVIVLALAGTLAAQPQPKKKQARTAPDRAAARTARAPQGIKVIQDVDYVGDGHVRHMLDIYVPENGEKRPLFVWVHGGGWRNGDKTRTHMAWILNHGYAMASINYRLTDIAPFPAQIHDAKAAIRFLRANAAKYGYDATKIAVGGTSAGGHLAALLGTSGGVKELEGNLGKHLGTSSAVQAVVDFYGPSDFRGIVEASAGTQTGVSRNPVTLLLNNDPKLAAPASPIHWVGAGDPPMIILQGDSDTTVRPSQSTSLHEAYQKARLDSTLIMIEGAGHGGAQFQDEARQKLVLQFLNKHIKGK